MARTSMEDGIHLASRLGAGVGRFQVLTSLHKGSNAWVNENNPSSRTSQLSMFLKELHHAHDDDDTQLYLLSIFRSKRLSVHPRHLRLFKCVYKECGVRGAQRTGGYDDLRPLLTMMMALFSFSTCCQASQ